MLYIDDPAPEEEGAEFPFDYVLTLEPLVDFWRNEARAGDTSNRIVSALNTEVLEQLGRTPELLGPIDDLEVLSAHADMVDVLMAAVFPPAARDVVAGAAFAPFTWRRIYATPAFARDLTTDDGCSVEQNRNVFMRGAAIHAYHTILSHFYGVDIGWDTPPVIPAPAPRTGLTKYFKITVETRFMPIERRGELKPLSEEEIRALLDEPTNLDLWKSTLPPEGFAFRGFVVLYAVDMTEEHVLSLLREDLLQKDAMATPEKLDFLQLRLRTLLGQPALEFGLVSFEQDEAGTVRGVSPVGRSLLLANGKVPECPEPGASVYARAVSQSRPVVVRDLCARGSCTAFESHLLDHGIRSVLLTPLRLDGQLIGLLELGAPEAGALSALSAMKLQSILTLFATALKRSLDEREDRLQAVIKKHYTAIHPVIEWRFRRAALQFIQRQALEGGQGDPQIEPIVFRDVIPLYGLSDIRDSSTHRTDAVREDLSEQLRLAGTVVEQAYRLKPLPALGEIVYQVNRYRAELETMLSLDHESSVLHFLQERVESVFSLVEGYGEQVRQAVDAYRGALDPELGFLYRQRKLFEQSVALVNNTISSYLDEREREAQVLFPHYFEAYETDGVDYNVYAGPSLLEDGVFTELQLQSLRIWQLVTTSGIARRLHALRDYLPVPLDTAHLVLVQSTPLAIRFRADEKQFDADGAYNIRYEVTKKRIDKAQIRGTGERLTQPGKIAIVYSSAAEEAEYRRYLEYVRAEGLLEGEVEQFDLEDMQGVFGLKALRATVRMGGDAREQPAESREELKSVRARSPRGREDTLILPLAAAAGRAEKATS